MKITPETPNSINMLCYDGDQLLSNVVEIDCEAGYYTQYVVDENGEYVISDNAIRLKTIHSKNLRATIKEQPMKTKLVPANLTVETFIQRTTAGEVFYSKYCKYYYDGTKDEPFRLDCMPLREAWAEIHQLHTREPITWQDEVNQGNPILCWVWDNGCPTKERARFIKAAPSGNSALYADASGMWWKNAEPVDKSECWGFEGERE
ncbi:MAG: hypothetical protein ACPG47_02080 [Leucothrix sp.]